MTSKAIESDSRKGKALMKPMRQLESIALDEMAKWGIPGISIAVSRDDEIETMALGIASIATDTPVAADTLFQIGSISKIFTSTLVMTCVDDRTVELDTPVIQYLPDLRLADVEARGRITLRHLLTHTSGIHGDRFDDHGLGGDALAKAISAFSDLPQQTRPGELWTYCNAGFDLAGRILEVATGRGFEDLMRERVFDPLGLDTTTYFAAEAIRHPVSVGHTGSPGELTISNPWPIPRRSNPAGGVITSASQLLRFAQMHMGNGKHDGVRVLSATSAQAMRAPQIEADAFRTWGIGWGRLEIDGEVIVEHKGSTNGFMARLLMVPGRRFAVAVLTNHADGTAVHNVLARAALRIVCELESPEVSLVSVPAADLAARQGRYSHRLEDLTLTATEEGYDVKRVRRHPFAHTEKPARPYTLRPVSDRTFVASGGGMDGEYLDFILNRDGGVRFLRSDGRLAYPQELDGQGSRSESG
jgi:CubicO group peptidase (beta-lactamase class C family)